MGLMEADSSQGAQVWVALPGARPADLWGMPKVCLWRKQEVEGRRAAGVWGGPWGCFWEDLPVSWVSWGQLWKGQEGSGEQQRKEGPPRRAQSWQLRQQEWYEWSWWS